MEAEEKNQLSFHLSITKLIQTIFFLAYNYYSCNVPLALADFLIMQSTVSAATHNHV